MRRVGEITEMVGGLNRNAGALSPKYALARLEPFGPRQGLAIGFAPLRPALQASDSADSGS
jgi:hypothetical protein